jgi:hypothetical protein
MQAKILPTGIHGRRVVKRNHMRSAREGYFREPPCPTPHIEDCFPSEVLRGPSRLSKEALTRNGQTGMAIELCRAESIPLETKIAGVVL